MNDVINFSAERLNPDEIFKCVNPKGDRGERCGCQCLWYSSDLKQWMPCIFLRLKHDL